MKHFTGFYCCLNRYVVVLAGYLSLDISIRETVEAKRFWDTDIIVFLSGPK